MLRLTPRRSVLVTRRPIPDALGARLEASVGEARSACASGRVDDAWAALEVAHILSQPWWRPHVRVHWLMLRLAVRTRDRHEIVGQLLRVVVAGPGSVTGRYPVGNTGRSNVPATQPMPMPEDLAALLAS